MMLAPFSRSLDPTASDVKYLQSMMSRFVRYLIELWRWGLCCDCREQHTYKKKSPPCHLDGRGSSLCDICISLGGGVLIFYILLEACQWLR